MVGLILSVMAFAAGWFSARRSVGAGMAVVLVSGYFYGILRARHLDGFSHFIVDAAVFGLYLGHFGRVGFGPPPGAGQLYRWTGYLIGWPIVMFGIGFFFPQHPLIQLVGLRAAIWFLPFLLVGGWARETDLVKIARTLAVLNLAALAFGIAEYFMGVPAFFPRNAVTDIIYKSNDVAGYTAFRIPATFSSSAAYGGTMVASLPLLFGRWLVPRTKLIENALMIGGILAAVLGIFLCAARSPVVILFALGLVVAYHLRGRAGYLFAALLVAGVVAHFVSDDERLQRFMTLQDTEYVADRLAGSMNLGTLDVLLDYPMGVGLGGAWGTSIPGFLAHLAPAQIGAENEYARIGLEQGLVGLALWLAFLVWLFAKRGPSAPAGWRIGGSLMWSYTLVSWATAFLGCGMLTAIPGTTMLLFQMGVVGCSRVPGQAAAPPTARGGRTPRQALPPAFDGPRRQLTGSVHR